MTTVVAIALAKFLDPILLFAAFLASYPIRRWWLIPVVGLILGVLYEGLNQMVALAPATGLFLTIIPAWIAATAYVLLAFLFYRLLRKARLPVRQPARAVVIVLGCAAVAFIVIAPGALLAGLSHADFRTMMRGFDRQQ